MARKGEFMDEDLKEEISYICNLGNTLITYFQNLDNHISYDFINYVVSQIAENGYCNDEVCYENFILGGTNE
jgi:hypothetical protein